MLDLLDHCHGASVAKAIGPQALVLPKDQAARLTAVGAAVSAGTLARLWQLTLKAYDEVRRAPDAAAATDMAIIRLAYAADLPGPEEALKRLQSGEPLPAGAPSGGSGGAASAGSGGGAAATARSPAPQMQVQPAKDPVVSLATFEDMLALIEQRRDIALKLDVERYVRPISFRPGLVGRLKEWTGERWLIAAHGGGGAESAWERQKRQEREVRAEVEADPFVREVLQAFPGAEIVGVRNIASPEPAAEPPVEDDSEED
jgi:DNA polymerase-3 subunit gamma/tau